MERTEQSRPCTAVPQLTELAPRPAEPTQRLTARPLGHDLDPYKVPETPKPAPEAKLHAPTRRPGALIGRGLFDSHHTDRAFGKDLPGGAA